MELHCPGHERRTEVLDAAMRAVLSSVDLRIVVERTAGILRELFGSTRLAIFRVAAGKPGEAEVLLVDDPIGPGEEAGSEFVLEGTAAGLAIRQKRPVTVEHLQVEGSRFREESSLARRGYGTLVSFPLLFDEQVLGTLEIAHKPHEGLLDCCFETAERVSSLVAIALHNSLMVDEVRRLNRLLDRENTLLKEQIRHARGEARYIAESPLMKEVLEKVRLVAPSDTTVLIRGETGTGKEGLARMIHEFSPRFGGPLVVVNLGALPETLLESELFGYEKGAFTGALKRKAGRFEQAEGGTIFLDEVGDAPLSVQVRLLRALQEREIHRVGGAEPVRVNVRLVAATHRPLEEMIEAGTFRSDLYYRLKIFPIDLPPLRHRREDIRPLGTYFLARQSAQMHRKAPDVPEAVWKELEALDWPGNIRELENYLQRALILSPGPELVLPFEGRLPSRWPATETAPKDDPNFDDSVREVLRRALERSGGRIYGPDGAAAQLGLKPTTLQGKLRKYRIKGADPEARSK